ncbi:MAG: transposase [Elusimicrobia bacterium]|nr:transposase [Elusimicrobiota bacterium]
MPRPPRIHYQGAVFHAISRGNDRQQIFIDDFDNRQFLSILGQTKGRYPFNLYAYCLMSNHFHLLIEVKGHALPLVMQSMLTRYAHYFNARHGRIGHLFQGRYRALLCQNEPYLLELLRYIHRNPVRAKIVEDPSAWPWSSCGQYFGLMPQGLADTGFPLSLFDNEDAQARAAFRQFLLNDAESPHVSSASSEVAPCRRKALVPDAPRETDLDVFSTEFAREVGIDLYALRGPSRLRSVASARKHLILQAATRGFGPSQIARYLNRNPSLVSRLLRFSEQVK